MASERRVINIMRVKVLPVKSFEDIQFAIDKIAQGEPLIVSCAAVDEKGTQRFLDIMSGAIYALEGSVNTLNQRDFLYIPHDVEITKEQI